MEPCNVYSWNGNRLEHPSQIGVDPRGETPMFSRGGFTRERGFHGHDGLMRIVGLDKHLARLRYTAQRSLRRPFGDEDVANWRRWVIEAVRASGHPYAYIHVGVDRMQAPGTMLDRQGGGNEGVFISVETAPPLYGLDGLHLSSEMEHPRPDGVFVGLKTHGAYTDLMELKERARDRRSDLSPREVEALLFSARSFVHDEALDRYVLRREDPLVAEAGCANLFAIDAEGRLHIPDTRVRYFHGITLQIVVALFEQHLKRDVIRDLRRNHLRRDGCFAGTACGVGSVVDIDHEPTTVTEQAEAVALLYKQLCMGGLGGALQEEWAPVAF